MSEVVPVRGSGAAPAPLRQPPGSGRAGWWWLLPALLWGALVGGGPLLLGPPGGDDAYYHAQYAVEHARCWRGGVLLPTWYPDLVDGLGAPEPRARPALPLALHAAFALAFDDAVAATSLATLLIPVVAGLVGFGIGRRRGLPGPAAAAVGVAWASLPYLVVTLHQRAALQEAWAVALLPWVLDAMLPPRPRGRPEVVAAAVAFAVLSAVQLLVAFMVVVTVAAAHLLSSPRRSWSAAAAGALGLLLAAGSWWPNVVALRRVEASVFTSAWFDWRHRLLLAPGSPDPELATAMTWTLIGVAAAAVVLFIGVPGKRAAAVGVMAVAALATPLAAPIYASVPGFALLQFPWRWLAVASALTLLAGAAGGPRVRLAILAGLIVPTMLVDPFAWRLGKGPSLSPSRSRSAIAAAATRYGVPSFFPPFPAMLPRGIDLPVALEAGRAARAALPPAQPEGPARWRWEPTEPLRGEVALPLAAAEGWRTSLDGREVSWGRRDGLITVDCGAGVRIVEAEQIALPEDVVGRVASIVGVVVLGWMGFSARRRRRERWRG